MSYRSTTKALSRFVENGPRVSLEMDSKTQAKERIKQGKKVDACIVDETFVDYRNSENYVLKSTEPPKHININYLIDRNIYE